MRKRLMSILISAMMILTSLVPITANAEETVNIFETYTFEEFLALSKEEICAISDEVGQYYTEGEWSYDLNNFTSITDAPEQHISVVFTDAYAKTIFEVNGLYQLTPEQLFETLMLPAAIESSGYDAYSFIPESGIGVDMNIKPSAYSDYNCIHVFASVYTWISMNPNVKIAVISMLGFTGPTLPETGDVDENNTIDISDATEVLTIYANTAAGLSTAGYTAIQLTAADVDGNGTVDITDATAILTYYAQKAAGLDPTWEDILAS